MHHPGSQDQTPNPEISDWAWRGVLRLVVEGTWSWCHGWSWIQCIPFLAQTVWRCVQNLHNLCVKSRILSRWWFRICLIFTPTWGMKIPILTNIFQVGWNHQLVIMLVLVVLLAILIGISVNQPKPWADEGWHTMLHLMIWWLEYVHFSKKSYGCWTKNRGEPPQIIHFNRVWNHYEPSILGYHYFWKHPY